VRLLLDTHIFLWWKEANPLLGAEVRRAVTGADIVCVSAASAWEVAIKSALGRIRLPATFEAGVVESGFNRLAVDFAHAEAAGALPRHHGDPFDRMLVAQALVEGLTLVTHDRALEPYRVPILWA